MIECRRAILQSEVNTYIYFSLFGDLTESFNGAGDPSLPLEIHLYSAAELEQRRPEARAVPPGLLGDEHELA